LLAPKTAVVAAPRAAGCRGGWDAWLAVVVCLIVLVPRLAAAGPPTAVPSIGTYAQNQTKRTTALAVEAADVSLIIYRGGEALPDGESVPNNGARVVGSVRYELSRPARAGDTLHLLNFAASMPVEPVELVETALETYIDGPFKPGALRIIDHAGTRSIERVGEHRAVVVHPEAGVTTVTLEYAVTVPKRYWPFGCVRKRCSLSGAVAPLPSVPAKGGRYLPEGGRVVVPVRWTVDARLAGDPTRRPGGRPGATPLPRPYEVVVVGGDGRRSAYPSVFWGPRWYRAKQIHRGVEIEVLHMRRRPSAQTPDERFVQLRRDLPGHALAIATEAVDLLTHIEGPQGPDSAITFVHGPLRSAVAEAHPDVVVLSDHALEIFPSDRLAKFHLVAVARSTFDMLARRAFTGTHDPSTDLWLPGMVAFAQTSLWRQARDTRDEFAADILRNLTFVPAVDRFLYTQQAAFSQSYFRGVEDAPAIRNHPLWYSHALPTGRRIHEKLVDTIGPRALGEYYERMTVAHGDDPQAVAEHAWGHTLDWFFDQWLGPYPSVDYVLHRVQSERLEGDAGWSHTIAVERVAKRPVIEPVQVFVEERDGTQHHLIWNGELRGQGGGASESLSDEPATGTHTWSLQTSSKIKNVRLDPRSRLLQQAQAPHENVDPRFNDRRPHSFRFLYTGAGFSFAASEFFTATTPSARLNAIAGFANFEGSLRRDLRVSGNGQIFRDRENRIGGGLGTNFGFGRKVNNQRRRARVRVATTAALLDPRNLDPRGGLRLVERLALIDNTRRFGWWPQRGHLLSVGVSARHTLRVDGEGNDDRHDIAVGAGWAQLWPIAQDHVLATLLSADVVVPLDGALEFRGLLRTGGIGGLTGYAADEVFGRALSLAKFEYRHVYVRDLDLNFAHAAYLRTLGGTAFVGVGSTSRCDSYSGWFGKDSYYAHVGYGLSGYFSILGVTPQLAKLDVSVPLVRRTDVQCLGETLPDYLAEVQGLPNANPLLPPFNINLSFVQSF